MIPSPKEIMKLINRIRGEDAFIAVVGCVLKTNFYLKLLGSQDKQSSVPNLKKKKSTKKIGFYRRTIKTDCIMKLYEIYLLSLLPN